MGNLKRSIGRYLGIGMAVLLVLAALYLPQWWFALRDAASLGRVQGEALAPLMVAQLDRSYERDIYQRMCAYMEAQVQGDVNCSSKEIDPGSESLWENMDQVENGFLTMMLRERGYVLNDIGAGLKPVIESCIQYVLMRRSDGQILLVANNILLDKGDGCHMELLIDGVDGTVYYLESEENHSAPQLRKWFDGYQAWDWWWLLNDTYHTEDAKILEGEDSAEEVFDKSQSLGVEVNEMVGSSTIYVDIINNRYSNWGDYPALWIFSEENTETLCCLLTYGTVQSSWSLEIEEQSGGEFRYRIRLGLPGVVNSVPEMARRISLAEYDRIFDTQDGENVEDAMP